MHFRVTARDARSDARCGELTCAHGMIRTPAFMPVGTQAAVKAMTPDQLLGAGAEIVLANAYHLFVRPGIDVIERIGGLHPFMGWPRPILTDSGGFQVFSLGALRRVSEEGVAFRSHLDGAPHLLTPEVATDVQRRLGADIIMAFDECLAHPATHEAATASMELSSRWARRCREAFAAHASPRQMQFGIVQGGIFPDLRQASLADLVALDFDGYAVGGLSVGEPKEVLRAIVAKLGPALPAEKPRYLMGVGTPAELVEAVACGIDLFDCVLPTRGARHGLLFTSAGRIIIKNARYGADAAPPDPSCGCYTCRHFSRAYLRHLYLGREPAALTLQSIHNIHFYLDTMAGVRQAIESGLFTELRQRFHAAADAASP